MSVVTEISQALLSPGQNRLQPYFSTTTGGRRIKQSGAERLTSEEKSVRQEEKTGKGNFVNGKPP